MTHPIEQDTDQQARFTAATELVQRPPIAHDTELGVVVDTRWASIARPHIETMIIGGAYNGKIVDRPYVDEHDARTTHAAVVEALRAGTPDLDGLVA